MVRINSMELLAELYELAGDKSEALETKKQVDAYRDSVMTANHSIEIADWQQKYDEERWRATTMSTNVKWGGVILVFSVMLALVVWWHRRRVRNIRFQLDEHARRIAENQTEIERLQQSGEASEQTIAELNRQIETSRERISNKLLIGTRAFVKLQQKESVADMKAE